MKVTILTSIFVTASVAAAAAIEARDGCIANNCLRAVRATLSQSRGYSDCSTYLVTTVTPTVLTITTTTDTVTIPTRTVTITSYTLAPPPGRKVKRDPEPVPAALSPAALAPRAPSPTIPAYASPCSSAAAYISACSCLGLLPRTSTFSVPPSTTVSVVGYTTTASVTVTATVTSPACQSSNNYGLIYGSGAIGPPPNTYQGGPPAFASTAYGCCAACYQTEGCIAYEYFSGMCAVSTITGPIVTPANAVCPYGITSADLIVGAYFGGGPTGDVLGLGPCSVPCAFGVVGGYEQCVGPYNGT